MSGVDVFAQWRWRCDDCGETSAEVMFDEGEADEQADLHHEFCMAVPR